MDASSEPKARRACINCRRQKMKCRIGDRNTCVRCKLSGLQCVFVPRANASACLVPNSLSLASSLPAETANDLLRRVKAIEEHLGLSSRASPDGELVVTSGDGPLDEGSAMSPLWHAAARLQKSIVGPTKAYLWQRSTIRELWQAFNANMTEFHFLPKRLQFSSPQPLLLASILYCSSARGNPEQAKLSPHYFNVLCNAIAQLCIPGSDIGPPSGDYVSAEEWAFQTVLGLVLAVILSEANVPETGVWITIAYRLTVQYCPPHIDEKYRDWRSLFKGVQIIDLEHASLHMVPPTIPVDPPRPSLQSSRRDELYRLSRMMHAGLTHFSGRDLPTIWSCFTTARAEGSIPLSASLTSVDSAVIRDWARQLDDWLVQFGKAQDGSDHQRMSIFRQYVLHRLVVLSIYHPARGFDLHSNSITPQEQHELLISARATLKLHLNDERIWANWDMVLITWAALIVLQAVEVGIGESDDLRNIRIHLDTLKRTNEPKPNLRDKLATCLERSLEGIQTPSPTALNQPMVLPDINQDLDYTWQIFNQTSLEQVLYPVWPEPAELHPT